MHFSPHPDFYNKLKIWYRQNRRELPWRNTSDPYKIWISEVILQQTRVNQGLPYYERFVGRFPDVFSLATADEMDVLKVWQGLGYYSRARNLLAGAKQIVNDHGGKIPSEKDEILIIKGIGDYTAAAILSIAYKKPYPVLDGNVYRFFSRMFGIDTPVQTPAAKKIFTEIGEELIDKEDPASFNQAIMEFGATVCIPASPDCHSCIFVRDCVAYQSGKVKALPVKLAKQKARRIYLDYFIIYNDIGLFLNHRSEDGIWKGLYDFPAVENSRKTKRPADASGVGVLSPASFAGEVAHLLTHRRLSIRFFTCRMEKLPELSPPGVVFCPFNEIDSYPHPKPVELFLQRNLSKFLNCSFNEIEQ